MRYTARCGPAHIPGEPLVGILVGLAGGLHPFLSFPSLLGGLGWSWNTTCCHVCAEKDSDLLHTLHLWEMETIGVPVERMHPYRLRTHGVW